MTPVHGPAIIEHGAVVIVTVQSEQIGDLWRTLEPYLAKGCTGMVLDLSRTTFLDSVNIAAIISLRNKCEAAQVRHAVANMAPNIQVVFRILKLDRMFDLSLDLDKAIAKVSS